MTILDSGEIPRLHSAIVDTDRLDVRDLQPTRPMRPYLATAPISPLARYQTDGHATIEVPATIGVVDFPGCGAPAVELPQVLPPHFRPLFGRPGVHRRRRGPLPTWAWLLIGAGLAYGSQLVASLTAVASAR